MSPTASPIHRPAWWGEHELGAHLERRLKASGQQVPGSKPILEINPQHALIGRLKAETDAERFGAWAQVLFDQALFAEGGQLDDPAGFVKRINALMLEMGAGESRIVLPG